MRGDRTWLVEVRVKIGTLHSVTITKTVREADLQKQLANVAQEAQDVALRTLPKEATDGRD